VPTPRVLFEEAPALDRIQAFVLAVCPELEGRENVYRHRPAASPARQAISAILAPTTPSPTTQSLQGETSEPTPQRQRWLLAVTAPAAGSWDLQLLGEPAAFVAGPGDDAAAIRDGIQAALAGLGAPITTSAPAEPEAALEVLGDVAGASLGLLVLPPAGGARSLVVVDDAARIAWYDWGSWTIRVILRDVPYSDKIIPAPRYLSTTLAERLRRYFAALDVPAVNGEPYPTLRDLLESSTADGQGPALRAVRSYGPFNADRLDSGVWSRAAAVDLMFQVPVALAYDVPTMVSARPGSLAVSDP
jgi:hypothetical protein